jgi:hypothetical protein
MPAPVSAVHVLALLTRVRADQVAAGQISSARLHDVRAYKCVAAELGYLYRLARGGRTGGTIVTSMAQLVQGLARLHPAWRMDGDKFADRDRHHSAVRRRLRALEAMGLLRWRVGVDVDGEDARTELELLEAPAVGADELADAAAQLTRWRARYGAALNTGSRTGIRNAAKHARPLSASQRQRRAIIRTRARSHSRRPPVLTNSAPHFVAPPTSENNNSLDESLGLQLRNGCVDRTGVTRASAPATTGAGAACRRPKTAALTPEPASGGTVGLRFDTAAVLERVAARERAREPVLALIAAQAQARTGEVRTWALDRGWPRDRLREAWVCARHGARFVAEYGASAAGWLRDEDYARLRRAVARYERNSASRPVGYPASGLAALLHIGELAGAGAGGPRLLGYAIGALDQLSRRMRAVHTEHQPARLQRASRLARDRRTPSPPTTPIAFRIPTARWPRWVQLDDHDQPVIVDGKLLLRDESGGWAPPINSTEYRVVLRDAYLLSRGYLAAHTDGRAQMADHSEHHTGGRSGHAAPGPYPDPRDQRDQVDRDMLELAHRSGMTLTQTQQLSNHVRASVLAQLRQRDANAIRQQAQALHRRLTNPSTPPRPT